MKVKVISLPYIFPGFVCFVLYLAKISGERLQDHWSSGLDCVISLVSRSLILVSHYDNMPILYTIIFTNVKNVNFQMKNSDLFLIFALKNKLWVHIRTASMRRF